VQETIKGLKAIRKDFSNLILGAKTTIVPVNVDELEKIVRYAHENELFAIISPCIIAQNRYMNTDLEKGLIFTPKEINAMVRFYEDKQLKWYYHRKKLLQYLKTGTMKKLCSCGFNYIFIRSTGDLFFCPLMDTGIGNI
jgi:MoaA/NifB/PqqE/SkfB family radical SAM enzyme